MTNLNLIVLSYHKFVDTESDYRFSRTYEQFGHDIRKKVYDLITIDDGKSDMIQACLMMTFYGIRAKLFVCPGLVGTKGYCTWDQLRGLSQFHDIENHSYEHLKLTDLWYQDVEFQIATASEAIEINIGKRPRFFISPWNSYNEQVDKAVTVCRLQSIKERINIQNNSK